MLVAEATRRAGHVRASGDCLAKPRSRLSNDRIRADPLGSEGRARLTVLAEGRLGDACLDRPGVCLGNALLEEAEGARVRRI
jgi:hypothetical protein